MVQNSKDAGNAEFLQSEDHEFPPDDLWDHSSEPADESAPNWDTSGHTNGTPEFSRRRENQASLDLRSSSARTDAANAKRFACQHGDKVRWCETWGKWLVWDRRRWAPDAERAIDALAKQIGADLWTEAAKLIPNVDAFSAREITSFCRMTSSARGISNMLALAKSEPGIPILPAKLDTEPWALNCLNGTLDLRTGELRPHRQSDLLTKLCPSTYDPAAVCPAWESMLAMIMGDHADLVRFLQRASGYSISGSVDEQCLFLLWGTGANGKTTFLNAIIGTLGPDYAMQAPDGLLMVRKGDEHPTERADLFGMRFVSSVEVEEGRRLAESTVKQFTGGDPIRARRMRQDFWQFEPTHKLWMAANHKPVVRGTDHGIWRRMKLVPFVVTIPESEQDKELPEKLAAERSGILAWLVRGCLEWQRHGLSQPTEIAEATAEYRSEMDVVGAFISECCVEGASFAAKASDVYAAYVSWCKSHGEYSVNQRRFGLAITERGIDRYPNNGIWYRGLAIATEGAEGTEHGF